MPETNAAAKAGELTEAEYGALYELWTKSPPKVSGDGKGGFFMRRQNEIAMPGSACAAWPQIESETARKMAAWRGKKYPRKRLRALPGADRQWFRDLQQPFSFAPVCFGQAPARLFLTAFLG